MTLDPVRLQTLVLARAHTSAKPMTVAALAKELERFAPVVGAAWKAAVEAAVSELIGQRALDEQRNVIDRDALGKRLSTAPSFKWPQLTDRVLPMIALGLPAREAGNRRVLEGRDEWAAAIAARALGFWHAGAPPRPPVLCDQLVWQRLGLTGKVQRLPDPVRALFLQRELGTSPAPTDRLLRLLAARELGVMQPELRRLRDALVRRWLEHEPPGSAASPARPTAAATDAATQATTGATNNDAREAPAGEPAEADFAADLHRAITGLREGVYGDHKVFISAAWEELRQRPAWRQLSLETFKARLLAANRAGEVVLARADLVGAMDPQLVDRSETNAAGVTFHFIVRRDARQGA